MAICKETPHAAGKHTRRGQPSPFSGLWLGAVIVHDQIVRAISRRPIAELVVAAVARRDDDTVPWRLPVLDKRRHRGLCKCSRRGCRACGSIPTQNRRRTTETRRIPRRKHAVASNHQRQLVRGPAQTCLAGSGAELTEQTNGCEAQHTNLREGRGVASWMCGKGEVTSASEK